MIVKSKIVRWVDNLVLVTVMINMKVIIVVNIRRGTPRYKLDKNIKVSEK
jgi:hypothetical protein